MRHAREKIGSIRSENNNKTRSTNGTNDRISKEAKTPVILHKLKRVREKNMVRKMKGAKN